MFSNRTRIILSVIHLLLFACFMYAGNTYLSLLMILGIFFQVYGYFRYNAIWRAFRYFSAQNFSQVKKLIDGVKYPALLADGQKGFYYMLKAAVNLYHDNKYDEVENDLDKALKTGVRTENNISIIHIMHARLYTRLKQYAKAGESLQKAKDIPHKRMLDNDMENLEKEIIELENKKR